MPTVNALFVNGTAVGAEKHFTPAETGFSAISVKAAASVAGNTLELYGCRNVTISIAFDNTGGGSTGLAKLTADVYDSAGNLIIPAFDVVTSMNLKADNTVVVSYGYSAAAKLSYTSGTPSLASNADILRGGARTKFTITTTEVNNGTTVTANMYVIGWA
jgi:hypothetical protein